MGTNTGEEYDPVIGLINEQKIAADVAFPVIRPVSLELMIEPFWA